MVWVGDGNDGCGGFSENFFPGEPGQKRRLVDTIILLKSPVGSDAPDAREDFIFSVLRKADVGGIPRE